MTPTLTLASSGANGLSAGQSACVSFHAYSMAHSSATSNYRYAFLSGRQRKVLMERIENVVRLLVTTLSLSIPFEINRKYYLTPLSSEATNMAAANKTTVDTTGCLDVVTLREQILSTSDRDLPFFTLTE